MDRKGKYGLIIPSKEKKEPIFPSTSSSKKGNVFGEESDSEEDAVDWVKHSLKKQSHGSVQQKQSTQVMKKALKDDPTVYQYDELYDEMEKKREDTKQKQKGEMKPKYIGTLLKTAERRQREFDERQERDVQKEREAEGDMFKDKEAFVTGAYRKKMEELEKAKEDERRKDEIDVLTDVTKQKDLSGFYRHLYRQQLGEPDAEAANSASKNPDPVDEKDPRDTPAVKEERLSPVPTSKHDRKRRSPSPEKPTRHRSRSPEKPSRHRSRSPRKSKPSPPRRHDRDRERHRSPVDYRHRASGSSRRRSRSSDRYYKQRRSPDSRNRDRDRERRPRSRTPERRHRSDRSEKETKHKIPKDEIHDETQIKKIKTEKGVPELPSQGVDLPKKNTAIWEKRTVGAIFTEALARYLARKQANTHQASIVAANA